MPDAKISALTAVTTAAGTDEFAVNQGAASKKETLAQITQYVEDRLSATNASVTTTVNTLITVTTAATTLATSTAATNITAPTAVTNITVADGDTVISSMTAVAVLTPV